MILKIQFAPQALYFKYLFFLPSQNAWLQTFSVFSLNFWVFLGHKNQGGNKFEPIYYFRILGMFVETW